MARAGRFGTKGLAITFVSDESDARTLNDVQDRFEVNISELPEEIDISSYSKFSIILWIYFLNIYHIYIYISSLSLTLSVCVPAVEPAR